MRISELARRSGVPTATIKYYLREGLLPAGELTAATQAQYGEAHLERLGLIRALLNPGRLSIAEIKGVLAAVDDPPSSPTELLGRASQVLAPTIESGDGGDDQQWMEQARAVLDELGWTIAPGTDAVAQLAGALAAIDRAQLRLIDGGVVAYAQAVRELAGAELDTVPDDSPQSAVRQAVLGTVLIEPLLLALRRLALQDAANQRYGGGASD